MAMAPGSIPKGSAAPSPTPTTAPPSLGAPTPHQASPQLVVVVTHTMGAAGPAVGPSSAMSPGLCVAVSSRDWLLTPVSILGWSGWSDQNVTQFPGP